MGFYVEKQQIRRTLNNQYYLKSREKEQGEYFRQVTQVSAEKIQEILHNLFTTLRGLTFSDQYSQGAIDAILTKDWDTLQSQANQFNQTYLPISILPPDQYMALVVQLTEGCNFNQCLFCNFYKDRPFRIKHKTELQHHLADIKSLFGKGLRTRKSVFLADANALVTPQQKMVSALRQIRTAFPELKDEIYSFIDVFTGMQKDVEDYRALRELGLRRVYLGIESGYPPLLELLKKPQDLDRIVDLTRSLHAAGIRLGLIFLIGAGGDAYARRHLTASLDLIQTIRPRAGDIIYLSEFHETNWEYLQVMKRREIPRPDRVRIRSWSNEFKTRVREIVAPDVRVSVYDINQFFY